MFRPFSSYFTWGRASSTPSPRAPSPSHPPEDSPYSPRLAHAATWHELSSPTGGSQGAPRQHTRTRHTDNVLGSASPAMKLRPRGLELMQQECCWIGDSLRRTDHQLEACSLKVDQMQMSAVAIRLELESLQKSLATISTRRAESRVRVGVVEIHADADASEETSSTRSSTPKLPQADPTQHIIRDVPAAPSDQSELLSPILDSYTTDPSPLSHGTHVKIPPVLRAKRSLKQIPAKIEYHTRSTKPRPEDTRPQSQPTESPVDESEEATPLCSSEPTLPRPSPEPPVKESPQQSTLTTQLLAPIPPATLDTATKDPRQMPRSLPPPVADQRKRPPPSPAPATPPRPDATAPAPAPPRARASPPPPPSSPTTVPPAQAPEGADEEHQRTPRSMRARRRPDTTAPHGGPRRSPPVGHAVGPARALPRASLQPVVDAQMVAQMAAFWAQREGK